MKKLYTSGLLLLFCLTVRAQQVMMSETEMVIPTYQIGPASPTPVFYRPENYQAAQLHIYSYAFQGTSMAEEKTDKSYKALLLENEYLRICVLPELGGRWYYAVDKRNGYDFIYRNNVVKPALVGMTGAWFSGGVEWNIPHHHRASTFMPVDYRLEEHADGSKTIWVGEFEKRHQSRWVVGLTLYPGKAYVECAMKLFNTTPYQQSHLMWANAALIANEHYRVIFPPDVETAYFHAKVEYTANGRYPGRYIRALISHGVWM